MESGTIAVNPKKLSVGRIVDEVIKELSVSAGTKSIRLTAGLSPKSGVNLVTDPLILKEVITNLASNGIKYTPDGGSVDIRVHKRDSSVVIEVRDSGWGIPKFSQDQIFSKFFRAQNIVKRETTGTGLGLYLVKGLVDALGGRIRFKSEEGKGTVFKVSLPLKSGKTPKKSAGNTLK
jgi:signal transduction histidine kinase